MKPPICRLCNGTLDARESRAGHTGDWVAFADYEALPERMVGHPRGLEWFCSEHVAAARALSSRSTQEALIELQRRFGRFSDRPDSEEFHRLLGRMARFFQNRFRRPSRKKR
jgi:hypothetical protein